MKVLPSTKSLNNTKINEVAPDYEDFRDKTDKCYLKCEDYNDLLDLKTDSQEALEVLDISELQLNNYNAKMEMEHFDESCNIKDELFNGAVADLVNQADLDESNDETSVVPSKRSLKRKKQLSMSKLQLSVRTTPRHYAKMFEFFEVNPGLATGQLQKISYRKKWRELTNLLNSEGLGEKSTEKWQKTWSDYKLHLRKKISTIKQQHLPDLTDQFTEQEERALRIVGLSLTEDTSMQAQIQKRFNPAPIESVSEDSSSHSSVILPARKPPTSNDQPKRTKLKYIKQQQKYKRFLTQRKSLEYRQKTLKQLSLIRLSLNSGLNRIGNILQLLVKKNDSHTAVQLANAATALAASASSFAEVLNFNGATKAIGNN